MSWRTWQEFLRDQIGSFEVEANPNHWRCDASGTGLIVLPCLALMQVDALAGAWLGTIEPKSTGAVSFIREFFPSEYRRPAGLLYFLYRHGTVHQFLPKTAQVAGVPVGWKPARSPDRTQHLRVEPATTSTPAVLQVVGDLLFEDTVAAGHKLLTAALAAPSIGANVEKAMTARLAAQPFPAATIGNKDLFEAESDAAAWVAERLKP